MADFNALEALINAHIKKNGVQAITGNILNGILRGMVAALGKGYTIAGSASPATDPGTMTGPLAYIAYTAGTYTHFGGLEVEQGEVAMLIYNEAEWHKEVLFSLAASATIDGNVGTPEVGVSFVDGQLTFDFRNMKGNPGDPAGFGTVNATVDGQSGTPSVSVQSSGPDTAKNFTFAFTGLKGETGVTSVVATVDNTSGTPSCAVSLQGQQLTLAFTGLKGAQGNTGVSADYPIAIINNLTTDDPASALSAAQGVVLDGKVSQLEAEVDNLVQEGNADFAITDENFKAIAVFSGGHIQTKNFDSSQVAPQVQSDWNQTDAEKKDFIKNKPLDTANVNLTDLDITDEDGDVLVRFSGGHIKTKYFDSRDLFPGGKSVILIAFMGQSNMAGRGLDPNTGTFSADAIDAIEGAGYEFKAITDPTKLYDLTKRFGREENKLDGIFDGDRENTTILYKTGGCVPAFVNAFWERTKIPIVAVSASEGGTDISKWQKNASGGRYEDAVSRINACAAWLTANGYAILHKYIAWCQGETDGDIGTTATNYKTLLNAFFADMVTDCGIEKLLNIRIGQWNGTPDGKYNTIINAQNDLCQNNDNFIMLTTVTATFKDRSMMKDTWHYTQAAYNMMGEFAGNNFAEFYINHRFPMMYDSINDNLFYSKNMF